MHIFSLPTRLVYGADALSVLKEWQGQTALLVTDPYFTKNGTAQRLLSGFSPESRVFSEVTADPSVALAAKGARLLEECRPRVLLALGGGSAIDCAKGMLAVSETEAELVAIPTTSGTGSEVTSFAILTHEGVKKVLVEERLRPKMAILDETLLQSLPSSLIADAGMDTLCHALEAAAAKKATPFSDALAISALNTVLSLLPASFEGDKGVRGEVHCAACMAGIAFDHAGLGACHALSHALGGRFHLPHGRLNAVLLPQVLEFNLQKNLALYNRLAKACGLSSARGLVFAVRRLRRQLKLPQSLTGAGIPREQLLQELSSLCETALADPCTASNPRSPTRADYAAILRKCL